MINNMNNVVYNQILMNVFQNSDHTLVSQTTVSEFDGIKMTGLLYCSDFF